jgi:uncharacterized protein YcfL
MLSINRTGTLIIALTLNVSCSGIVSSSQRDSPQFWPIPLAVELKLSKTSTLKVGETISANVTLKNRSNQLLELPVIGNFFYITAVNVAEMNAPASRNDLTIKEDANTILIYPSPNLESRAQAIYRIEPNSNLSSGDRSLFFGRAGRYIVRGIVRLKVPRVAPELSGETEVMLYSSEVIILVEQ